MPYSNGLLTGVGGVSARRDLASRREGHGTGSTCGPNASGESVYNGAILLTSSVVAANTALSDYSELLLRQKTREICYTALARARVGQGR